MKKYTFCFLILILLLIFTLFVGCSKLNTQQNEKNKTGLPYGTETETETNRITPESTNLVSNEDREYEEYFSEVRPYEIKRYDAKDETYPEEWDKEKEINDSIIAGQNINYDGFHTSNPFECNCDFQEDRLYIVDYENMTIDGYFSEFRIYNETENEYCAPFLCRDEGVYAVINHTELALLDYNGEKINTIYTSDEAIKHFFVLDKLAWIFSDGIIYRVFIPSGKVDLITNGIDTDSFQQFYYPISNYEIQWAELDSDGRVCSNYYNAKTGESKTKYYKDNGSDSDLRGVPYNMGWWFISENCYEQLDKFECELPENYSRSTIDSLGLNVCFSCGGAVEIYKGENLVGWISLNYEYEPVFEGEQLISIKGIHSWYKLNDFETIEDNKKIVKAEGLLNPYYYDFTSNETDNYRFAFVCEGKDEPVYALILKSEECSNEEFMEVVNNTTVE